MQAPQITPTPKISPPPPPTPEHGLPSPRVGHSVRHIIDNNAQQYSDCTLQTCIKVFSVHATWNQSDSTIHFQIISHHDDHLFAFSLFTPCSISDLFTHLITLPFIGKAHLIPTNASNPSSNVITHISPTTHATPFHFIQTHDFFYCATCHLPILKQRIYHAKEQTMYHPSCFHLTALPYPINHDPNNPSTAPPNSTEVIFLSPSHHPNSDTLSFHFPITSTILEVTQTYSSYFQLQHTAITVNGTPARVYISSGVRLHQLSSQVYLSHSSQQTIPLPWPWSPLTVQVVCLPHHVTPYCGRPRIFHLDSSTPLSHLPSQFASHAWCDPSTNLHIFWLTTFASIDVAQDLPGSLTLKDFGPQILIFELDSAIFTPNISL